MPSRPSRHQKTRRSLATAIATAPLALGLPARSRAAGYPDKPVRMIVPYPAGGGADQWSRIVAGRLEKVLGQAVVFDYKPGASTTIGAEATARSAPDGYTIHLYDTTAFAYVPHMRKVGYDPIASFTPLAHLGSLPMLLVANPALPFRNLQELVAYAKANPGKLNCASAGVGSPHHLIAELFKARAGIQMNHVPYKGAVQYIADLVGGQVDLAVSTLGPAMQHLPGGRLRGIAISSGRRSVALPDIPTIAEQGYPGFDEKPWNCFVAPAGLPAEITAKLRAALRSTLEDAETLAALRKTGLEDIASIPVERLGEQMRAEFIKWGDVIRQAKITLEG